MCIAFEDSDLETERACSVLFGDCMWLDWPTCGEGEFMKALVGCEADLVLPGGVEGVTRNCDDIGGAAASADMLPMS